ncbi:type II toxin-antitoxin system PemK/MazF family toxin [Candidatus Poriferisodalis sp.]|uniref:type II toxin-antitoxin system PemK/MazF family toxin n=1 Tax=Candidatus Poriferisodalis sp. TaxID=3101277 RepID=UPI003B5B44FE
MGHEQQGRRFGIVVQSDALLRRSAVLVAPTSTWRPCSNSDRPRTRTTRPPPNVQ